MLLSPAVPFLITVHCARLHCFSHPQFHFGCEMSQERRGGGGGGGKEQQSDCSVNLDSATNSLLTSCFLLFSSLSSFLLGYCLGSRCLFRHLWFTSLGLALQGPAQPCLDTLCLIQISTVPVHHPCTPNLHREFGRSSSPSPHPSQIVLQYFGLHICRM